MNPVTYCQRIIRSVSEILLVVKISFDHLEAGASLIL
jgi:hypothetical protein